VNAMSPDSLDQWMAPDFLERRQNSECASDVKAREAYRPGLMLLVQQQRANQKAANRKEDIDANSRVGKQICRLGPDLGSAVLQERGAMSRNDKRNGNSAPSVQCGNIRSVHAEIAFCRTKKSVSKLELAPIRPIRRLRAASVLSMRNGGRDGQKKEP
jgi:hypothetical protein